MNPRQLMRRGLTSLFVFIFMLGMLPWIWLRVGPLVITILLEVIILLPLFRLYSYYLRV
jgi:hypothetical protein